MNYANIAKNKNLKELHKTYSSDWDKLKPNEKVMIEDLYYNGGNSLVGIKTEFRKNIAVYAKTSDKKNLTKL